MAELRPSNAPDSPPSFRSNIAANIASNAVIAAGFLASVPFLVAYLGAEGYGLVGVYLVAQSIVAVLDMGLGTMLTREAALLDKDKQSLSDLVRTSEVFYWSAAVVIVLGWLVFSGNLTAFLNPGEISESTLNRSFLLMGLALGLQLPLNLYTSVLYGLQRQAAVSFAAAVFSVLRNLAVIPILHFVSSSPEAFLTWQSGCIAVHVPVLWYLVRSTFPKSLSPSFRPEMILEKWRLAAGIGSITLLSVLLIHVDRIVLARLLPLEIFGYYALAAAVANGLHWLVQPVFKAFLPRLSQLTSVTDRETLTLLYHQGCQLLSLIVFPVAAFWIFFSYEAMLLWQQDERVAANSYVFVSLLVMGGVLNGILFIPYALQLAFASTRLQLRAFVVALGISIPMTTAAAVYFGAVGAAAAGIAINLGILTLVIPAMHRRLLPGEGFAWLRHDVVAPLLTVGVTGAICRLLFVTDASLTMIAIQLAAALALMGAAALASSSHARQWIAKRIGGQ